MTTRKAGEKFEKEEHNSEEGLPELKVSLGRDFQGPLKGANMTRRKSALGRGLSALLSSSAVPVDISNIPLAGVGGSAIAERAPEPTPQADETPLPKNPPPSFLDLGAAEQAQSEENSFSFAPEPSKYSTTSSANSHLSVVPDTEPLEGVLVYLSIDRLSANPDQPRKHFSDLELNELSQNIKKTGLLQPLLVRRKNGESGQLASYEIVAGERRFRAAKKAGLVKIPAILKNLSDQETLEIGIIENVQRANLNPLEEAQAYQKLIDDFGSTQSEVAEKVGKDRVSVANLLRLLKLAPEVQNFLATGKLSAGHGRALLMCSELNSQLALAQRAVEEGLSVRQLEQLASGKDSPATLQASKGADTISPEPLEILRTKEKKISKKAPNILALEERLRRVLGTKIALHVNESGSGEVKISFFSLEELQGLVERLES